MKFYFSRSISITAVSLITLLVVVAYFTTPTRLALILGISALLLVQSILAQFRRSPFKLQTDSQEREKSSPHMYIIALVVSSVVILGTIRSPWAPAIPLFTALIMTAILRADDDLSVEYIHDLMWRIFPRNNFLRVLLLGYFTIMCAWVISRGDGNAVITVGLSSLLGGITGIIVGEDIFFAFPENYVKRLRHNIFSISIVITSICIASVFGEIVSYYSANNSGAVETQLLWLLVFVMLQFWLVIKTKRIGNQTPNHPTQFKLPLHLVSSSACLALIAASYHYLGVVALTVGYLLMVLCDAIIIGEHWSTFTKNSSFSASTLMGIHMLTTWRTANVYLEVNCVRTVLVSYLVVDNLKSVSRAGSLFIIYIPLLTLLIGAMVLFIRKD